MYVVLAALVGALLNRLRGGLFENIARHVYAATGWGWVKWATQQRTQTMRAIYALPTGLLAWQVLGAGPWWLAVALVVSVFCGQAFFGNGGYLYDRPIRFPDWLGMARNFVSFFPAVFVSYPFLAVMVALGAFHAAMYWLAFRLKGNGDLGEIIVGAFTWGVIASFWI